MVHKANNIISGFFPQGTYYSVGKIRWCQISRGMEPEHTKEWQIWQLRKARQRLLLGIISWISFNGLSGEGKRRGIWRLTLRSWAGQHSEIQGQVHKRAVVCSYFLKLTWNKSFIARQQQSKRLSVPREATWRKTKQQTSMIIQAGKSNELWGFRGRLGFRKALRISSLASTGAVFQDSLSHGFEWDITDDNFSLCVTRHLFLA